MYLWVVFIHIAAGFGFFLVHGASVAVALKLRKERNPQVVKTLLDLSSSTITTMYVLLSILLGAGIWAGFIGRYWSTGWIWTSLVLLLVIVGSMYPLGTQHYRKVRNLLQLSERSSAKEAAAAELEALLSSPQPLILTFIGVAGVLVILWLMIFKPF